MKTHTSNTPAAVVEPVKADALAVPTPRTTALAKVDYAASVEQYQDEFDRSSLQIPFLRILQSNSPELDPAEAKHIEGATVGQFVNTVTSEIAKVVEVIPVSHYGTIIEWKTRENGGGYVKDHGLAGGNALLPQTTKNEKGQDILPNGNQLVRTEVYFLFVIRENGGVDQVMLTMTSTQLKKARQWNSKAKSIRTTYPDGSFTPRVAADGFSQIPTPLYANAWKLTSVQESNEKGKWYGYVIDYSRPTFAISEQLFAQAIEFRKTVSEGIKAGAVNLADPTEKQSAPDDAVPF